MRALSRAAALAVAAVVLMPENGGAQPRWTERARITLSAGVQGRTLPLSQSLDLTTYVEPAPITAEVPLAAVPAFDIGMQVRVRGDLGFAVSMSYLSGSHEAIVRGDIPHPFYFDVPRAVEGRTGRVDHGELALHTDLVYMLPMRRVDMLLFGGATFFRVAQDFVSDVHVNESYPYDTAEFGRADLVDARERGTGFNAGLDLTWRLGAAWGVGGLVRYAHARIPFEADGRALASPRVGGVQALGGLRIMLPVPRMASR